MDKVEDTLDERNKSYGDYEDQSGISQALKYLMRSCSSWENLPCDCKESLETIATKISRILNGDPGHIDSWHDIAGYSYLIERRIIREKK